MDAAGNVIVADMDNHAIRKISPAGVVSTFAGSTAGTSGFADGAGDSARFNSPAGVAVDADGNVYVTDNFNHAIRKISPAGVASTLAGTNASGFVDGTGSSARFYNPIGVVVDAAGNVFVGDTNNHAIRKITQAGVVSTLAGNGTEGYTDATGGAARFKYPYSIAVGGSGNVYVADNGNNFALRAISPEGVVSTLAGSGANGYRDGPGTQASFSKIAAVAIGPGGEVFVADGNHVRMVDTSGDVTTIAGFWAAGGKADGPGESARFDGLTGLVVAPDGAIYVMDSNNMALRKITRR